MSRLARIWRHPSDERTEIRGYYTQFRRDWSLLDLGQAAYDPARRVDSIATSERPNPCAGKTGITAYLEGGGTIEHAQAIANHESPKTTKLYDRTSDQIDLDEIEKIRI